MGNEQSSFEPTELKIRIWKAAGANIGHISLYIPKNFLYISFWPTSNVSGVNVLLSVPSRSNTYLEDVSAEEKSEDETIEATVDMNVSAMERCWCEIKANRRYSLANFNCADAVMEVLAAGNRRFKNAFINVSPTKKILLNINPLANAHNIIYTFETMMLGGNAFFIKVAKRIQSFKAHGFCSSVSKYIEKKLSLEHYYILLQNSLN